MIYLTHYRTAATSHTDLFEDIVYPQRVHWFPDTYKRTETGLVYVPHKLAEKVVDLKLAAELKEQSFGKTAFILAGGNQHFAGIGQREYSTKLAYTYKFLPFTLTQVYAGRTAQAFGHMDMVTTDASACASSLKVMMDVEVLMKHYGFERVIVLTVEDGVSNAVLEFFGHAQAVLTAKDEAQTGVKPSAFDSVNKGFYVGQGAALAVFESARAVDRLNRTPLARLVGAYNASEPSTNAIGQCEDGQGFLKAIGGVCFHSKVMRHNISIVKAHGTGTDSNNRSEKTAILGAGLKDFVVTSYKQKIGHTMGSSGLLETLLLLDDMKKGIVPGIANRTESDSVFLSQDTKAPKGYILSLAAGMGNIYSAAIFEGL